MPKRTKLPERLPCPFCGCKKQADLAVSNDYEGGWGQSEYTVKCHGCEAQGPPSTTKSNAVEYWNNRTPS